MSSQYKEVPLTVTLVPLLGLVEKLSLCIIFHYPELLRRNLHRRHVSVSVSAEHDGEPFVLLLVYGYAQCQFTSYVRMNLSQGPSSLSWYRL